MDGTQYVELDGALYTIDGGRGADITKGEETVQVLRDGTPGRCTVRVTVEVLDRNRDFPWWGARPTISSTSRWGSGGFLPPFQWCDKGSTQIAYWLCYDRSIPDFGILRFFVSTRRDKLWQ